MPREFLKKYMPDPDFIKNHRSLQFLGEHLHDPNLWHLNRRSVSIAFAIGLFFAWVPTPTQMAMAAVGAFYFRGNLPISVALVWITNPLTMPPLYYFAYVTGLFLLNLPVPGADFQFSLDGVLSGIGDVWQPFLFGCFVIGVTCATIGYFGIKWYWHYHISAKWQTRKERREPQNEVNYNTHYDN